MTFLHVITIDTHAILPFLFGTGGVGGIAILVSAYRRLKSGRISDEEAMLSRVHKELRRQEKRADEAEAAEQKMIRSRNKWREQATRYRLQLVSNKIAPQDMEMGEDD